MPIYEYRCNNCRRRISLLVKGFSDPPSNTCPRCGSSDLSRLISSIAVVKSEESRLEDLADPSSMSDLDENDPKSMARWMRKMGSEMGEDLGPEFDEMVDRMEAGEMPEDMNGGEEGSDDLD
ncbi:MAG: FmdB family zinc ribbon protein [Dehalococcoidia bacterium]